MRAKRIDANAAHSEFQKSFARMAGSYNFPHRINSKSRPRSLRFHAKCPSLCIQFRIDPQDGDEKTVNNEPRT
jgi:hypothetical protein